MTKPNPMLVDPDEALDAAAQGYVPQSPDDDQDGDEIGAMGSAAGIPIPDGKPLGDADPIERRDAHRWENDPASADDAEIPDPEGSSRTERG